MRKKFLAVLLALCMVVGMMVVPAFAAFDDVADDHWAASSIERWNGYGVLNGDDKGAFAPEKTMTRAEFAQMLVNMLGLTAKSDATFNDVNGHWAANAISIAVKAGIINGKGGNKFAPDDPVSFEEAAVMMCRAFGLAKSEGGDNWSKASIDKLTELGMIGANVDEHLQVGAECNRAVIAKLADNVVGEYATEDKVITGEVKGVVIAAKGAKVKLEGATVTCPIVVVSATVEADKDSTVADVIADGEAPVVEISGEIKGSVTTNTPDVEIKGDGVKAENVVNNTTEDIKVNGETVEGKADEPAPVTPPPATTPAGGDEEEEPSSTAPTDTCPSENAVEGAHGTPTKVASKSIEPTCTAAGIWVMECPNCHQVLENVSKPATGHDFTDVEAVNGAKACKNEGCDFKQSETPCASHTYGSPVTTTAATCTEAGDTVAYCTKCGAEDVREGSIPATGHTVVIDAAVAATCSAKGKTEGKHCSVCDAVIVAQEETDKLAHTLVDVAAKAPTCTEAGTTAGKKCSVCDTVTEGVEAVSATGHTGDPGTACSVCGQTIPAGTVTPEPEPETKDCTTFEASDTDATKCKTCGKTEAEHGNGG